MENLNQTISGWSKTVSSDAKVFYPENTSDVIKIIANTKKNKKSISIRGAGLSYGDNTLNSNGIILCTTKLRKIIHFNKSNGEIIVQSGVTFEDIYLSTISHGWLMPVMPGSRYVTIGGALGNNIHGKNCELEGNIGEHVKSFNIALSNEEVLECSRDKNSDIFYKAISVLGLIGVIIEITLKMKKVPSNYLTGQFVRAKSIENLIDLFEDKISNSNYSIATINANSKGSNLGKGVLYFASFIENGDYSLKNYGVHKKRVFKIIPRSLVIFFVKTFIGSKILELFLKFSSAGTFSFLSKKRKISTFPEYHFLMDRIIPDYNLFFKNGFFEYQALFPKKVAKQGIKELIKITHKYHFYSIMTSIKSYRKQKDSFFKSFELDGYGTVSYTHLTLPTNREV